MIMVGVKIYQLPKLTFLTNINLPSKTKCDAKVLTTPICDKSGVKLDSLQNSVNLHFLV